MTLSGSQIGGSGGCPPPLFGGEIYIFLPLTWVDDPPPPYNNPFFNRNDPPPPFFLINLPKVRSASVPVSVSVSVLRFPRRSYRVLQSLISVFSICKALKKYKFQLQKK